MRIVRLAPRRGKTYSFTGDLKIYETCPRPYQLFRDYDVTLSRAANTLEEVVDGK